MALYNDGCVNIPRQHLVSQVGYNRLASPGTLGLVICARTCPWLSCLDGRVTLISATFGIEARGKCDKVGGV